MEHILTSEALWEDVPGELGRSLSLWEHLWNWAGAPRVICAKGSPWVLRIIVGWIVSLTFTCWSPKVQALRRWLFRDRILTEVIKAEWGHFVVVQSPSHVQLFATPWTAARQASLSLTISWTLPKFMSSEWVMPSNHLILCCSPLPLAFNLSQHQGLFQWVSSSHQVAKVLELQLQLQSFQWMFRVYFL